MMHQHDIACCISVLFILITVNADYQDYPNLQQRGIHLPDKKFGFSEYSEYSDNDERDRGSLTSQLDQIPVLYQNGLETKTVTDGEESLTDALDKNIIWDSQWAQDIKFGQISAVSIDPNGNIGLFHRASRVWGTSSFDDENRFDRNRGPIPENTIILLDKSGRKLLEWGKNMFYLPHGLTIDAQGNYWVTDVALHQVLKFDAAEIARLANLRRDVMFAKYAPTPSLILGEAFEPGNDDKRFCKPTAVAVQNNGDFFVSDGYCNSRIIKFNAKGERILQWGRHWGIGGNMYEQAPPPYAFYVPHALALATEFNLIFVADRENDRVLSFHTNGTIHKEYKCYETIGSPIYSVAYAKERLYLVNGPKMDLNVNSNVHVRGFVLDMNSGNILSQFGPNHDMNRPHDIAVSEDGRDIYVAELNIHTAYKFSQNINTSMQSGKSVVRTNLHHEPAPLTDSDISNPSGGTTTATLVLSLVTAAVIFIALCIAIAAVVARCQKRGCLLIMRKRMRWEAERLENFKLSNILENRRGKGFKITEKRPNPRDFSKLNTEPETSEDEYPENSLTKVI